MARAAKSIAGIGVFQRWLLRPLKNTPLAIVPAFAWRGAAKSIAGIGVFQRRLLHPVKNPLDFRARPSCCFGDGLLCRGTRTHGVSGGAFPQGEQCLPSWEVVFAWREMRAMAWQRRSSPFIACTCEQALQLSAQYMCKPFARDVSWHCARMLTHPR